MARGPAAKKIKSAKRVLEVFEFFSDTRREATVMEIARQYGYPQSSTSELLNCLLELGFLSRDRFQRTYRPTAKVAMLGAWTHPRLFRHGRLLAVMDDLADKVGCTVVLAGSVNVRVEHYQVVHGGTSLPPGEGPGPLTISMLGKLLLSFHPRSAVRKIIHRLNSEVDEKARVGREDLMADVDRMRSQSFAISPSLADGGAGVVGMRLPFSASNEPLALGIVVAQGDARGCGFHLRALHEAVQASVERAPAQAGLPPVPVLLPAIAQAS